MQFLLQEENLTPYVEGALGRWFPVTKDAQEEPFWQADPHRNPSTTSTRRHSDVRVHEELEVHHPQQRERLGQGGKPRDQREGARRQGRRRDDRPHQAGRRLIGASPRREGPSLSRRAARPVHTARMAIAHDRSAPLTHRRPPIAAPKARRWPPPAAGLGHRSSSRPMSSSSCFRALSRWPTASGSRAHPANYVALFDDPIFARAVVNTLIFLIVGVNLKMMVALALSGFFAQNRWPGSGCRCSSSCPGRCRRSRPSCPSASCSIPNGASSTR